MKQILLFLSMWTILSFRSNYVKEFDDNVHAAYEEYRVFADYTTPNYSIKVVQGLIDNDVYYGVCFYNEYATDYKLRIEINDKLYTIKAKERNNISATALNIKTGNTFSIVVYDKNDNLQYFGIDNLSDITAASKEEFFEYQDSIQQGLGHGVKSIKPKLVSNINWAPFLIILTVLGIILLICVVIILIYYKKRKGMFSDVERKKNVFNFKEFIVSVEQSLKQTDDEEYIVAESKTIEKDETEQQTDTNQYTPHYSWARNEEKRSGFNIKKHLQELGFITDYRIIETDEKNKIMLELMRLKDQKNITQDDYLNEVSELWKE